MTGEEMDVIRKKKGWNKIELSKRLGLSNITISKYINNKSQIPKLVEIAMNNYERECKEE